VRDRTQPGVVDREWLDALSDVLPLFSLGAVVGEPRGAAEDALKLAAQLQASSDRSHLARSQQQQLPHWLTENPSVRPHGSRPFSPTDAITTPGSVGWEARAFSPMPFSEPPRLPSALAEDSVLLRAW
jgi:hypothetical protein